MSGVNIACNVGNQMGHGGGEMKFEVSSKSPSNLATCIAADIVNDILENALDIATMSDVTGITCDTIAFSVDNGLFSTGLLPSPQGIDEAEEDCPQFKELIEGLTNIHIPNQNAEEPMRLDMEMKKLLSEMMSPPYDIVNYDTIKRKDGVGDQPIEEIRDDQKSDDCLVDADKIKVVEKKSRLTDLVMNSKQVLSEYLSEESRVQQSEWEVANEQLLQVIEMDCIKPGECQLKPNPSNSKEEIVFSPVQQEENLVNVDLEQTSDVSKELKVGGGEFFTEKDGSLAGSSKSRESTEDGKDKFKRKFENLRKRKWNINLKFFGFGKRKQKGSK